MSIDPRTLGAWRQHLASAQDEAVGDPEAFRAWLGSGSLHEAFRATAVAHPDRPALAVDGDARTHAQLNARAARFAGLLAELGIGDGDPVLLCAPSSIALVEAYLGILRRRATVVLSNPAYTAPELRHLVEDSGAVAAITGGPAHEPVAAVAAEVARLRVIDLDSADWSSLDPRDPDGMADPALLAYTSGTTGKPKAVPLTHANVLSSIRAAMLAWRWSADDVLVHALPLYHQHGLSGVHATLLAGSRAVIHSRFDPERLCATIAEERATVLFAVPAIYERLVAASGVEALRGLRLPISGSAPLSPALAGRLQAVTGQLPLERYGTTESGLDISNLYDAPRRPGTVGLPLPGIEAAIVDPAGDAVPDGADGEIVLRGPQVFAGYRGNDQAASEAFHPGGWFRTGDIGRRDPGDGFVSITGRVKEVIISGGLNVYPREVELALEESDVVDRAAVVGVPSERWGEEVVAAVVAANGAELDPSALLEFASQRLAPYKRPKRVVVVEELPLNAMGKIVRADVAKLVSVTEAEHEPAVVAAYARLIERAQALVSEAVEGAGEVDPADDATPCP